MILLKNKDKKANIKIGNNIEIKDGSDFPFDLTLYGRSTQATRSGKNLFNKSITPIIASSGQTITELDTGLKISYNGTSLTSNMYIYNMYKLVDLTDYVGSVIRMKTNFVSSGNNTPQYILGLCDVNGNNRKTKINTGTSGETISFTVPTLDDTSIYLCVWLYCAHNSPIDNGDYVDYTDIIITMDNEDMTYEPYGVMPSPDFPSPIESITEISATVTGKNLLENKTKNSGISRGITFTLNGDGSYTLNGTNDGTGNATVFLSSSSNPTTLKAGTYYTIPTPNGVHITGSKIGGGYFQFASSSTSQFTLNEDIQAQIYIQVPNGITTTYNNIKVYPMISTTPITQTDYEQYKSNSLTIDLQGNELCSLPRGTKDEVNITNGEALLIKKIRHITRAIADMNNSDAYPGWTNETQLKEDYPNKNDSFLIAGINIRSNITNDAKYIGLNTNASETLMLFKNLFNNMTQTEIKANYPDLVLDLYYELAEPETINLGTVEMPHTYNGVSNITNSADTEMIVKYYKKFEFDKILRSGYNIDEQEYEIAKKQMANGKRKKILSSYVDCVIKIDLGLLDNKTYQEYKEQLEDGEYEYWSYKYNQYKKANFILTKPSITTEYAYDDEIGIDDMEITLEKSSDVS